MIPFEELSAALDRWRIRNGLPVVTADLPIVPDAQRAAAPAPFVMPASAPATQPRTPPPGARPPTDSDVLALGDEEVLEDDEYANEGGDFAMSFGGAPPPAAAAAEPASSPFDDQGEEPYEGAEVEASYEASYDEDPAYDAPPAEAAPLEHDAAGAIEEEEEEDWSRMPNFPGNEPDGPVGPAEDAEDDGSVDERTVVGDDHGPKR